MNGQPSVSLVDHRVQTAGKLVYRAIGGAGDHVGEDFFNND